MKTILILLITMCSYSQVGINTIEPTATLDVNGTIRMRVAQNSDSPYFVVMERDGTFNVRALPNIPPFLTEKINRGESLIDLIWSLITLVIAILFGSY